MNTATTINRIANHGMVILLFSPLPAGASCFTRAARISRNGASIMTRSILAITAAFSASGLMA
ncbi:hypothetical protein D3C75_1382180 [compost metagenome]